MLLAFLGALAGCTSPVGRSARPPPSSAEPASHAVLEIDSTPTAAIISVNGRLIGTAPTTYRYELDSLGDVAIDLNISADFSDSPGISRNATPPFVSHTIERGDRAPTTMTFDTQSASVR